MIYFLAKVWLAWVASGLIAGIVIGVVADRYFRRVVFMLLIVALTVFAIAQVCPS